MEDKVPYMPSSNFTPGFSYNERQAIADKYAGEEWRIAKRYIDPTSKRHRISKSAIKVAEVIKIKLDIDLFPLIIPVARKGYNISGGTAAFAMTDNVGHEWLFDSRASAYKTIKANYSTRESASSWISRD